MSILEKVISNICCNCFEIFLLQLKEKKSTFFSFTRVLRKDRLEWIHYWCSLGRRSRICGCRSGASPRLPWDYLGQCHSASAFKSISYKCSDYWIIFILFVAITSDWRPPWGKLMGTLPCLLHKVLHHVKRHAGGLPDQILLYKHFSPLHQPLIAINSNFVIVVIAWSEGCLYATGPTQTYSSQGGTENRNKKKDSRESYALESWIAWSTQKHITAQWRQTSEL